MIKALPRFDGKRIKALETTWDRTGKRFLPGVGVITRKSGKTTSILVWFVL